jgi:hypothetical protein
MSLGRSEAYLASWQDKAKRRFGAWMPLTRSLNLCSTKIFPHSAHCFFGAILTP